MSRLGREADDRQQEPRGQAGLPVAVRSSEGLGSTLWARTGWAGRSGIALGKKLPHMAIGFCPVDDAATQRRVDLVVYWPMWRAPIRNARSHQPCKHGIEFRFTRAKAVVPLWKGVGPFVEVDREARVHVDRRERADVRWRRADPQELGKQPSSCIPIPRGDDEVIEVHCHG